MSSNAAKTNNNNNNTILEKLSKERRFEDFCQALSPAFRDDVDFAPFARNEEGWTRIQNFLMEEVVKDFGEIHEMRLTIFMDSLSRLYAKSVEQAVHQRFLQNV